jgi:hypothetical protein
VVLLLSGLWVGTENPSVSFLVVAELEEFPEDALAVVKPGKSFCQVLAATIPSAGSPADF